MIKRLISTWRNHPLLRRLQKACRCWIKSRPPWDLTTSVKWLAYAGLFTYSMNLDSSDRIWEWRETYFGISVPSLTSSVFEEGLIAACLLASFIFLIEPLLPTRWSKQLRAVLKGPPWIVFDGALSWLAYVLGILPIMSATADWWGGTLVSLFGAFLLLVLLVKVIIDLCKAWLWGAAVFRTATSR